MAVSGRLTDKVAILTGAASGIGAACARAIADEGAHVILTDVDRLSGSELAETLAGAEFHPLDVTDESQWRRVIETTLAGHGHLDVLINNAGIGNTATMIQDMLIEDWRRIFAVNVEGTFLGMKHAVPAMSRNGGGAIVNMSSAGGITGTPGMSAYCGSKAAIRLMTKCVALECGQQKNGIRVNSVHPGFVHTDSAMDIVTSSFGLPPDDALAMMNTMSSVGRVGTPADIAAAVVYLASDESGYTTGTELIVDGGLTAQ